MRDQEIIGLWEAYQQVHAQPEEVEQLDEGVRPGNVETPLDKAAFKKRRRSLAGREASADARSRGHEEPSTGRTYSADEARSRRREIHTPEGKIKRDAARGAAAGEQGHGGPLRAKKVRKAKAMGELGEGVDIFDVILEHLVTEGYADTNEAALAIMANMSEEWKQSIVEVLDTSSRRIAYTLKAMKSGVDAEHRGDEKTLQKRLEGVKRVDRKSSKALKKAMDNR